MLNTFPICACHLAPGQFSSRIFNTDSSDGKLFILEEPEFYFSKNERLFKLPRGGQSDGLSAPQLAAAFGRDHGGDDWPAGWVHDGGYRNWLMIWDATLEEFVRWDAAHGRSKQACDDLLYECAEACGDDEAMAQTLYWAVVEFGKRSYQRDMTQ